MKVTVSPEQFELAPGQLLDVEVTVVNDGEGPLAPVVAVSGLDPSLVALPDTVVALSPGQHVTTVVALRVPEDANPGERRLGVSVADGDGLQRSVTTAILLRVGARPDVAVELSPLAVKGRRRATLDTVLRNRGDEVQHVTLAGAGQGVSVGFAAEEVVLDPQEEVHVRTTVKRLERSWLRELRHGALVDVRGLGLPVSATATFTQKPVIPVWWRKLVAVVAAFAVWAAAVVVINDRLLSEDPDGPPIAAPDGADADAGAEGDADDGAEDAVPGRPFVVQGTVEGPTDPIGTDIVIERISFGDEGTTDGDGDTKLAALTPIDPPLASVIERIETATDDAGRFRIASGLVPDVFYRLTALRPGYEVESVVVSVSEDEPELDLPLVLQPANGGISGQVVDQSGAGLGGAEVIVTDGALIYQTTSATEGDIGSWSIGGLATPAAYQVIVTRPGYATATTVVELDGGQVVGGVDSVLQLGLGTIRGVVTHRGQGVGAVTVELAGEASRFTTTLTEGELTGRFDFPALPLGVYTMTFSAPGWLTQTTEVVLDRGDVEVAVRDLSPSTAVVQGVALQMVAPGGGCAYPDPDVPEQRANAVAAPCGGVGVRLEGEAGVFSTTTSSGSGTFQISSVPPGEYTLAFERYGYYSEYFDVAVSSGDIITIPRDVSGDASSAITVAVTDEPTVQLASTAGIQPAAVVPSTADAVVMQLLPAPTDDVGEITGILRDSRDPSAVLQHEDLPEPPEIWVDEQPLAEVELLADGAFKITRLLPGAHTVNIAAPGFDVYSFVARVGRAAPADAGPVLLIPFGTLNMRVIDLSGTEIPDIDVFLTTSDPALVDRLNDRNADPAYDIRTCSVSRDDAGRWRAGDGGNGEDVISGLCGTSDAAGNVFFNQAMPTGDYDYILPVNEDDITDECDLCDRSVTVPHDHVQRAREISLRSGETERSDVDLQRYAIIEGILREPIGDTFETVGDDIFGSDPDVETRLREVIRAFPDRVGETGIGAELRVFANGQPYEAPPGLEPRFSYGTDADLNEGVYRIHRVLFDTNDLAFEYDLEIRAEGGPRAEFLAARNTAIDGLQQSEVRRANGVLQPRPVDISLAPVWQRSSGDTVPILGLSANMLGLVSFRVIGDAQPEEIRDQILVPGDPDTGVISTDRPDFSFPDDASLDVEFMEGRELLVDLFGVDDTWYDGPIRYETDRDAVDGPPEFPPGTGDVPEGADPQPGDALRGVILPVAPEADRVYETDFVFTPEDRTVVGSVAVPVGNVNDILGDLQVQLIPVDDDDAPTTASIQTATTTATTANSFSFEFSDVPTDLYRFEVRDPTTSTATTQTIFPIELGDVLIPPGPPVDVVLGPGGVGDAAPFEVDRAVDLTIGVFERFDDGWDTTATATPETFDTIDPTPVGGVQVTLRLDGEVVDAPGVIATQTTPSDGIIDYTRLRGGSNRDYTVDLFKDGYLDETGIPLLALTGAVATASTLTIQTALTNPTLATNLVDVDNQRVVELDRLGEVAGTVEWVIDVAREQGVALADAYDPLVRTDRSASGTVPTINLADPSTATGTLVTTGSQDTLVELCTTEACGTVVASATTMSTGDFELVGVPGGPNDASVTYWLRLSDSHDELVIEVEVRDRRRNLTGTRYPLADRASLDGVVTDADTDQPLANVLVEVGYLDGTNFVHLLDADGLPATASTGTDGAYDWSGLPPIPELGQTVVVRFTEFADAALTIPTSRYVQEVDVDDLDAGTSITRDVALVGQFVAIAGDVTLQAYTDGPAYSLAELGLTADDVSVELTCTAGGCGSFTATTTIATDDLDGDEVGRYRFPVLTAGTYQVTVDAPGFEETVHDSILVERFASPEATTTTPTESSDTRAVGIDDPDQPFGIGRVVDADLSAQRVEVRVAVGSDLEGVASLTGVTVTPTYATPPAVPPIVTPTTPTTGADGVAVFDLPPGTWTFSTGGANRVDLDRRPHLDAVDAAETVIDVATAGVPTTVDVPLPLLPYVAVDGAVFGRDTPDDTATVTLNTVEVVPQPDGLPVYRDPDGPASASAWTAYFPPTTTESSSTVRRLEVTSDGYDGAVASITVDTGIYDITVREKATDTDPTIVVGRLNDGLPPDLTADGIVLTAAPRDVAITVISGSTQALELGATPSTDTLETVTVEAAWAGGDPAPAWLTTYADAFTFSDVSDANGVVDLRLPPATWTVTTTGATDVDHVDAGFDATYTAETLVVPSGSTTLDAYLQLVERARITGRAVDADGDPLRYIEVSVYAGACSGLPDDPAPGDALATVELDSPQNRGVFELPAADPGLVPQPVCVALQELDNQGDPASRSARQDVDLIAGVNALGDVTLNVAPDSVQGTILGRSFPDEQALPLSGVTVAVSTDSFSTTVDSTTTDADGLYVISGLATGDYDLRATLVGYDDADATFTLDTVGATVDLTMLATPREVIVRATTADGSFTGLVASATLETTYTDTATNTVTTSTTVTFSEVADGVATATFPSVAPATWTLSTSGFAAHTDPHVDLDGETLVVSPGPAGDPVTSTYALDRFPVVVGTLEFEAADGILLSDASSDEPTNPGVSAPDASGSSIGTYDAIASTLTWTAAFDPSRVGDTVTATVSTDEFSDVTFTATVPQPGSTTTTLETVTATPTTVTFLLSQEPGATETIGTGQTNARLYDDAATATATTLATFSITTGVTVTTDTTTTVVAALPPGDVWDLDIPVTYLIEVTSPTAGTFDVPLGAAAATTVEAQILKNSVLYGLIVEDRDGTFVPLEGVTIRVSREDQTFTTVSGPVDGLGDNFGLRAQSGQWQLSAIRHGVVTVIDESFTIRRDQPGSERNWVQVELPWIAAELAGRITDDAGAPVASATVTATSNLGSVTATSDEDGAYLLAGLDPDVTWQVTFTPPEGALATPVSRFIAPGGFADAQLVLDQQLPSGFGHLQVDIVDAVPGSSLSVELSETTPFPTLNVDGRISAAVTASAEGTASVLFEDLVPGGTPSLLAERFTVTVVAGDVVRELTGLAVLPGMTTAVEVMIGATVMRDVALELSDDQGPITDRGVTLQRDGVTLSSTAPEGSNRYAFLDVEVGTWTVVVEGYLDATIEVVDGEGPLERSMVLTVDPAFQDDTTATGTDGTTVTETDGTTSDGTDGTTATGTDGTTSDGTDGTTAGGDAPASDGTDTTSGTQDTASGTDDGSSTDDTTPDAGDGTSTSDDAAPAGTDGTTSTEGTTLGGTSDALSGTDADGGDISTSTTTSTTTGSQDTSATG